MARWLRPRQLAALAVVIALAIVGLSLPSLASYPSVFIDEPWNANRAWNRLQAGENYTTIDVGPYPEGKGIGTPSLASAVLVVSFRLLGLGLFQTRLPSLLFGGVLLLATYWVGRWLYGPVSALIALLLLGVSSPFLEASHLGRPDIVLAALVTLAVGFSLWGFQTSALLGHVIAGALVAASVEVHQNGLFFVVAMAALYPLWLGRRFWREPAVWALAAGGLAGLLVSYNTVLGSVAAMVGSVLPGRAVSGVEVVGLGGTHRPPLLAFSLRALLSSAVHEVGRFHFYEHSLAFGLIFASAAYLAVRRTRADRVLLGFVGVAFAEFVLLVGNKHDVYAILFYPLLMLIVAETLVSLLRARRGMGPERVFAGALIVLSLVSGAVHVTRPVLANRDYDYYAITDRIKGVVPAGARVMGLPNWWLGLAEYDYRSSLGLTYYHYYRGYSLTEALEAIRPDVIIVDSGLRGLLVDEGYFPPGPGFEIYRLPRREFEDFLAQRGQKLVEFSNAWHGRFEVYAIRWD